MELLYALIPLLTCTATLFFYKRGKEQPLFMYIPFGVTVLVILLLSVFMRESNFSDTEYLSYYITKVRHYDAWNERVQRTRRIKIGDHYQTQIYYVTENHKEKWAWFTSDGHEVSCTKEDFDSLRKVWATPMIFVDMHRHYYTKDGDAQDYGYCGHWNHMKCVVEEHPYKNRVMGSKSVLRFREISKEEADTLGLYHYSKDAVMGSSDKGGIQKIEYLNAEYGRAREVRFVVLIFPASKGPTIAEDQKAYWQGGNKNELVICVGVGPEKKIEWVDAFSWQDNPELDVKCASWLMEQRTLDLVALGAWLEGNIGLWERKEFKDFSYIGTYLTSSQNLTLLIITILFSILGPAFTVMWLEENRNPYM